MKSHWSWHELFVCQMFYSSKNVNNSKWSAFLHSRVSIYGKIIPPLFTYTISGIQGMIGICHKRQTLGPESLLPRCHIFLDEKYTFDVHIFCKGVFWYLMTSDWSYKYLQDTFSSKTSGDSLWCQLLNLEARWTLSLFRAIVIK